MGKYIYVEKKKIHGLKSQWFVTTHNFFLSPAIHKEEKAT